MTDATEQPKPDAREQLREIVEREKREPHGVSLLAIIERAQLDQKIKWQRRKAGGDG